MSHVHSTIKQESQRLERLNSQLELTYDQIHIYNQEAVNLKESLQRCCQSFNQDICFEVRSIKAPMSSLCEVCEKVLLLLDIKDRSWKGFRSITKHYKSFKNLMITTQTEAVQDSIINEVLPLWRNQENIRNKLERCYGGNILLDWIGYIVELNVKNEILRSSQKRIPELERMIRQQSKTLEGLQSEFVKIEKVITQAKTGLNTRDVEFEDCSEASFTSKLQMYHISKQEERFTKTSTVHRGTASGGILQKTYKIMANKNKKNRSAFPNFLSDNLYGEIPVYKHTEIDEQIIYEGRSEMIGCCRMKFFCF